MKRTGEKKSVENKNFTIVPFCPKIDEKFNNQIPITKSVMGRVRRRKPRRKFQSRNQRQKKHFVRDSKSRSKNTKKKIKKKKKIKRFNQFSRHIIRGKIV